MRPASTPVASTNASEIKCELPRPKFIAIKPNRRAYAHTSDGAQMTLMAFRERDRLLVLRGRVRFLEVVTFDLRWAVHNLLAMCGMPD